MNNKIYPIILCGGSGTRLWPLSREQYPKQLLSLVGEDSLLQATIKRIYECDEAKSLNITKPVIVTNESHRFLVAEQLREIGISGAQIMLEPAAKNTAPALTLAAMHVMNEDPDGILLVMPADHVITDKVAFIESVVSGLPLSEEGKLMTFGIVPDKPETGYGYIKRGSILADGITSIQQFVEKPEYALAQQYVESGEYVWNSGMFLFAAKSWQQAIQQFRSDIFECITNAYQKKVQDMDFIRVDKDLFSQCPSESIDYAVMEHVTDQDADTAFSGAMVALKADWSDIGSWDSLWEISQKDSSGNVLKGEVFLEDTQDSMVLANDRVVSVIGLSGVVVIDTPDAVMVAEKSASQSVKKIVNQLALRQRNEIVHHRKVFRPWGSYESIDNGSRFQVKRIIVNPTARLSLQMHHHRAEHWIVVKGTAKVTRGEESFLLSENESTYIPLGIKHRLENPGTIPLEIIEVQSGSYLGEDDIVRYQDEYGRND